MRMRAIGPASAQNSPMTAPIVIDLAEAEVMRVLRRQGRISRTEITAITGWSKAKTSQEIRRLVERGLLVEQGEGASQGGRRPQLLRMNERLGYVVGIDIGASSVEAVLADVTGQVLQRTYEAADVRDAPEKFFGRCIQLTNGMINAQGVQPAQVLGFGIGVPGP